MSEHKRDLKVNLEDLKMAFDTSFAETWYYLDLATGEVVVVTEETRGQLEALFETTEAETIEAIGEAIQQEDLPDWQKEELHSAALVEFGYNSRFVEIPQADSQEGYLRCSDRREARASLHRGRTGGHSPPRPLDAQGARVQDAEGRRDD